ncbi:MAG: sensor domain-containing diguanylate cyclase [Chloroflexota bacterium]
MNSIPPLPQKLSNSTGRALMVPMLIATLMLLGILVTASMVSDQYRDLPENIFLIIFFWGFASVSLMYSNFFWHTTTLGKIKWVLAVINGTGLGLLVSLLPESFDTATYPLLVIIVMLTAIVYGRYPTYIVVIVSTAIHLASHLSLTDSIFEVAGLVSLPILSTAAAETILRMQQVSFTQISRLETINEFSRQISASLDIEQVIPLLNEAIKNAIRADTYYVGILEGGLVKLDLFYDDGEYFYDVTVPARGSLAGWVLQNNRPLFLPDLRKPLDLEGVERVIIGKDKTSLAWMGVPLQAGEVLGVLAVASYRPNAFDRSDMELLENLAQQAALVLHNVIHHRAVEEQSKLDSLTGVYNHGYFLKRLENSARQSLDNATPLSLIMLDVDFFKQYNDSYGHLAGDEVLIQLTRAIRSHIKNTDSVGRWGGEEFAICLPDTPGDLARQVALRIRETMRNMQIRIQGETVPSPTVSQGIAVFPIEADEIIRLIDLADKRLYTAKSRGRDQIEPDDSHWNYLKYC